MPLKRLVAALCTLLLVSGCARPTPSSTLNGSAFLLDTYVTVTLYAVEDQEVLDGALQLCRDLELVFSRTDTRSELYRLNHAGGERVEISEDLRCVLDKALYYAGVTGGRYDITICPVSDLWDFKGVAPQPPDAAALKEAAALVDYRNVVLDGNTAQLLRGASVDLGSIAKGYIADRMADYLREQGVYGAIINLGGNVATVGDKGGGEAFSVGIQKPFATRSELIGAVESSDSSVVCSGIYERYFEVDGTIYHHILDPDTGYPVDNELQAVGVLSERSVDGDALSTICYLLGPDDGMALINTLDGVEAVFMLKDGSERFSAGFANGAVRFSRDV